MKLLRVGNGKTTHGSRTGVNSKGIEYTLTICGSEVSARGIKQPKTIGEATIETVTCKKCLKSMKGSL